MMINSIRRGLLAVTLSSIFLTTGALTAQANVELDFWDQIWGPESYAVAAAAIVEKYNASQNDVHVTYRSVPWTNWYETYVTAIASGSAPDISTGGGFQAVQFYSMDAILPVDKIIEDMKADGTLADFAPGTIESMKYDGHYVALPFGMDLRALHYRKDILQEKGIAVPTTWDEFRAAAKATTGDGKYGLVSSGDPSGMHWTLTAMINNGGGLFDAESKAAITGPRSLEALEFLSSMVSDGSVNPASTGYTNDDARGAFNTGKATFLLGSPNTAAGAGDQAANIGIVPPLKGPHGDQGTVAWVNNTMIYKQTKHPAEALAFLHWWSNNQLPLFTDGHAGVLPARLSYQKDPAVSGNEQVKAVLDLYLPVAKTMAAATSGSFPQLNEIDGDGFLMSMVQQIWQGVPAAQAAQPAQDHLAEIMAKK
jgi:multiple sugar transport system substrate-binding protein